MNIQKTRCLCTVAFALALLAPFAAAGAQGRHVLYHFCRLSGCADGSTPVAALIPGPGRTLYGTTAAGGANRCGGSGCGTVFKLTLRSTEAVIYSFKGGSDGESPPAPVISDRDGNLYGTTAYGGLAGCGNHGCGTIFRIASDGTETVFHAFNGSDGGYPQAGLIADKDGNLYGTTYLGGATSDCSGLGCGTVFKLSPDGIETVLHAFTSVYDDGYNPAGGLIADGKGNFYGTTTRGGGTSCDCGTVFKLAPDGTETILHAFSGSNDGDGPQGTLVRDASGNLYGTTVTSNYGGGYGTVFKVKPNGIETVLHVFSGQNDGQYPLSGLIADATGNLYGTTRQGGGTGCGGVGCGTAFKLAPDGTEKLLWSFKNGDRGAQPWGGLWENSKGLIFGTTTGDASGNSGTIFKLTQ
jgi:uncharacterized repeat protein (TIGR03803 family)